MQPETIVVRTADTAETRELGRRLAQAAREAGAEMLFVDLRGELGAGKTVFARGLACGLDPAAGRRIVSPTFTIARSYVLADEALHVLHHLDAYRLRDPEELDAAGFEDMWGPGRITCVEWGEHVEDALPMDRLQVELRMPPAEPRAFDAPEAPREIRIAALGPAAARVLAAIGQAAGSAEPRP